MTTSIAETESPTKPTVHERRFYSRFCVGWAGRSAASFIAGVLSRNTVAVAIRRVSQSRAGHTHR